MKKEVEKMSFGNIPVPSFIFAILGYFIDKKVGTYYVFQCSGTAIGYLIWMYFRFRLIVKGLLIVRVNFLFILSIFFVFWCTTFFSGAPSVGIHSSHEMTSFEFGIWSLISFIISIVTIYLHILAIKRIPKELKVEKSMQDLILLATFDKNDIDTLTIAKAEFNNANIYFLLNSSATELRVKEVDAEKALNIIKRITVSASKIEKLKNTVELPAIENKFIHSNFMECEGGPTSGPGGKLYDEAIVYWNKDQYDKAFILLKQSIGAGISAPNASFAHSLLGQIHIKRNELILAVNQFLSCLELQDRTRDATWMSAVRLAIIYKSAGRTADANSLDKLSHNADTRGLMLSQSGIQEIEDLAKRNLF
jgi:hypothetical protein